MFEKSINSDQVILASLAPDGPTVIEMRFNVIVAKSNRGGLWQEFFYLPQ